MVYQFNSNSVFARAIQLVLAAILVLGPDVLVLQLHSFPNSSNSGYVTAYIAAHIRATASSLIATSSFFMHLFRVQVAKSHTSSLPFLQGLLIGALVITTALNIFFSAQLFLYHPEDDLYLYLTMLTCLLHGIFVEVRRLLFAPRVRPDTDEFRAELYEE